MVLSVNIPLKPSEEAVVKFLLGLVFGSKKTQGTQSNRRECLRHDVFGASQLIRAILKKDKKNRKSWIVVCNLVYGNTIVLKQQVARLLYDAIRAKDMVTLSNYITEEEERKRKTRELIEEAIRDEKTPKKKRRSKAMERDDDYLITTPMPAMQALKQNITMADVVSSAHKVDNPWTGDELAPVTDEQYDMLYNMLEDSDGRLSFTNRTFIDRYSSNTAPENVLNVGMDMELDRPTYDNIQELYNTPRKENQIESVRDRFNENTDILRFGLIPILSNEGQKISLDEEMESARHRAIDTDLQIDSSQPRMEVPRLASEQISLLSDAQVVIPKKQRASRTPAKNQKDSEEQDVVGHMISLKSMHRMMEDFSSLHYSDTKHFLQKPKKFMSVKQLLDLVPFFLRENCDTKLWTVFDGKPKRHEKDSRSNVSNESMVSEPPSKRSRRSDYENLNLEPIDLSQMKVMMTPLKEKTPASSPIHRSELEPLAEVETARRMQEEFNYDDVIRNPISPRFNEQLSENMDNSVTPRQITDGSHRLGSDDRSAAVIRENLLAECQKAAPYTFSLESVFRPNVSRREAARTFYVTLELLKERELVVMQREPFDTIELQVEHEDSDDIATVEA
ncbi:unnamed protein product [Caenorhabditis sp. 36 PRJEB53466]|nr:unnamed protein product [Caenorhabditis sp. 36 PRJEB53466]